MNKRQMLLGVCLFIVFLSALSVVSASDTVDDGTIATANDDLNTISATNDQGNILRDSAGTFTDLNDKVKDGGNVSLERNYTYSSGDTSFSEGISIDKSITIDGQGFTIDASNSASIFNINATGGTVILKNINFINAKGTYGGAIKLDPLTTLEIINCNFTDNAATSGGAIYVANSSSITSTVKIIGSTFINNTASYGGAVYLNGNSTNSSTIETSTFIDCTSSGDGGAAYISASNVVFKDLIFENNIAGDDGGAIYWEGHNGVIYNITCINNKGVSASKPDGTTSSTRGGTICLTGGNVTISDSKFISSSAFMDEGKDSSKVDGGALFVTGNGVNITNVEFINCNATNAGGALYVIGNNTVILNCTFENNTAGDGAALYVDGDGCKLIDSTFTGNIADDDGGAIFWQGSDGEIYNITCISNKGVSAMKPDGSTSSTRGGTICLTGSNVTVTKSRFISSSAYMDESKDYSKVDGGALFITGNGVIINDTVFDSCTATNNGGALYIIGNDTQILNCDFNNCIGRDGGAIYVQGDGCKLYNATITDSIANDDGGAIYWDGDNGYIYNITCVNNKGVSGYDPLEGKYSNSKGGTICLTGSNVTIAESSFSQSSAKVDGGALFITGNDVNVIHSDFNNCKSTDSSGGAVYIIGNSTNIVDCTFDDCNVDVSGDHRGGAIFVAGNDANITNSSFTNTKALIGGAIFIEGNDTIVDGSTFSYNTAAYSTRGTGGAINVNGANAIISNSEFSQGSAVSYGGAIAVWGPNAVIVNNTFDNSKTTKLNGGAIYVNGANATISLSNFTQCNALGDSFSRGGAIDVDGNDTKILNCNFDDCDSRLGGVIYVSGANAFIEDSTFKNSEAYKGAAIYVEGVDTTILKSNFTDVTARDHGGAIYVEGANANISQSNFIGSKVTNFNGGAIYIAGENTNIEKSNFTSTEALNKNNKALGGAIYIEGADAVIKESDFDNCKATEGGGAIYAYGNSAKIVDSTFNSSTAKYGGAIYLTAWGASVTGSNITQCIATQNGGGVYVAEGSIQIAESNFDDCIAQGTSASNGGGAIYINGPDTHILASNFSSNKVPSGSARGGSIFIKGERTIIEGSEFEWGNAYQGGEIYIEGADAIIDTSAFINSSSRAAGGSIYVKGDEATIRKSSFDNISAKSNGGAIYVDGEKTNILDSSFYNCTVGMSNTGGAIYIDDIGTTVAYSNFTLSRAGTGGAIYINGKNTTITYCNLHNNTANTAGAIMVHGDDTILSNSNFTYNTALTLSGGALDIGGSNASVYYSWFDHNEAHTEGGAINWIGGHGDDSIIGSTFTNNICYGTSKGGGAIHWTASTTTGYIGSGGLIQDSVFINNTAAGRHGGALNWFQTRDSKINNCLFINNTANSDGGALYTGDQRGNSYNLNMSNCQFYNNTAGKYGGAIANQMANSYVFNNTFDGNLANAGGGSILMKEGPAKNSVIDHCYIYNSRVGDLDGKYGEGGGAILLGVNGDSNITISNSAIMNSTIAKGPGGAIAILGAQCSLINVSIENASTQNAEGGAIYWKGTDGYMNNVTIFKASSHSTGSRISDGGAIYVSGWNFVMNDTKIFEASANTDETAAKTNYGGAIYIGGSNSVLTNIIIDNATSANVKMNGAGGAIYQNGYGGTLINATISNTYANGNGGAIYWKGSTPSTITNISITYSQTEVFNSTNSADGGAIYSTTIGELSNVTIEGARAYKNNGDVHGGAIYLRDAVTLNNITVEGSRASTDDGTSYGGAVFLERNRGSTSVWVYNSTFDENNADLGGGLYFNKVAGRISGTSLTGNVANKDGGALYGIGSDIIVSTSEFEHNSAKRGGAIFSQNVHIQIDDSIMEFNTAEEKGGAIYHNYIDKSGSSWVRGSDLINNTAFQGSAIYVTKVNRFTLANDVLLDNQANSNKFIEKHVGVDEDGNNYTSAIFLGFDNLLNAIWQEATNSLSCTNVTYWGVDGKTVANSAPTQSDREVNINVTVEMYDDKGVQINTSDLVTDKDGKVKYTFDAKDGETYYFAYVHKTDRYYTYLRDTLSNSSLVKIYVYTPIFYAQNQTVLIELTDGAWGNLNGTVTVTFNDTAHTTFTVDVVNGTGVKYNITDLAIGKYNATASFAGDINHTGDTDWTLFEVLPYDDVEITKDVNITAEYVNVTDVIKYTITVTNHGPSKAYNVNVTERLSPYLRLKNSKATKGEYNLTGGYWYIGELDVDDFETLTIIAEVIHMGPITNAVWVTSLGKDINETNNNDTAYSFTAVPIVDLRIDKKVNVTKDVINVLDVIKFDITVYNDGPCNATGVIVEELVDDHLQILSNTTSQGKYIGGTWNIGNMTNGTNATLTIVAKVVYSGNISNVVHVSGFENETDYTNNYARIKNMTAVANVNLKITKDVNVSGVISVTDKVKFTITVTNEGPCNATGVYVGESLSPHLQMISNVTTKGEYDGATWIIGNLNNGEVHTLTIIAEVISEGNISNAVAIFGNDNDTNKSNNNDSIENFTAINTIDLEINKTVDGNPKVVNVTDVIVFTITVRNNGPCTATNVNVTEVLSPHLRLMRYNTWGGGYYNVTEGVWYIGNLTKDEWRDLVIVAEVISAGDISNVVVVTGKENDTNKSNNNDSIENITAIDIVDLQIKKEVNTSSTVINVTDSIKYTITVFNAGPCNATNVNVSEVLSPHLKMDHYDATGGTTYDVKKGIWYIGDLKNKDTAVLTIYAQVISNGTIANVVIVNCTEKDTDLSNNKAEITNITAVNIVDLRIEKEVNTTSTDIDITEILKFTITVTNDGPCNATNVYVCEPLSYNLKMCDEYYNATTGEMQGWNATKGVYKNRYTWIIGNMTVGETATLTIVAKSEYAGVVENEVNVTCNEIDTNLSNNYDNITPIRVSAHIDLGINKTVNATTGVVNVSDIVEFTIVAYNNGPCNASGVYVLEALDFTHLGSDYTYVATNGTTFEGNTWFIDKLDAHANATLIITARVIAPGNFSNYVQIFGWGNDTNPYNNNDTVNVTAIPVVDLEIAKVVNANNVTHVGDTIIFTIDVWNQGPCDATKVTVSEVLSPHLKMDHYETWASSYDVTAGVWDIGTLAKGDWRQLVIYANVISAGNISNVVVVTSTENDTNTSNNNASIPNITARPIVDLQIKKEVNVTSNVVHVLDEIKYTITVFNDGPCNATDVNVSEVLSSHLELVKNETVNGYYNVSEGVWHIGDLANKSTAVLTITAKVISDGFISNVVIVNCTEDDSNLSNNRAEVDNTAVLVFDLQINKTVNSSTDVHVTDVIQFVITVYNAGPCNATGVYVSEPLSGRLSMISHNLTHGDYDGYTWNIYNLTNGETANLTIVARVVYSGIIENVVVVTGNGIDTNLSNNKDNITPLNATTNVDLAINKTVNATNGIANVGEWVEFTITAYNNCSYNATGVYVSEALDFNYLGRDYTYNATEGTTFNGNTWNIGFLNAGATATLKVVARVIAPGNFSNYVEIFGYDPDTNPYNNNATVNITARPVVDLQIAKDVDVDSGVVYYGDTITFTITVRNNGPCDATNVNVTEVLNPHLSMISNNTDRGYYDVDEGVWHIGTLAKGQWTQLVIVANVTSPGNFSNAVVVNSTEMDTNTSNNNASIPNITAKPIVDLKINKTVNVTYTDVNVTEVIKFTLTVVNDGPCNATNVYVCEPLSYNLKMCDVYYNATTGEMQGWNATKGVYKDRYTWVIGNMTSGETATLTIVARIVYSGIIENAVNVTSNDDDIDPSNNYDDIDPLTATTKADLAINKTVNVTTGVVNVSDLVEFTITAYNYGPCNASGVYVLEALDSNLGDYTYVATPGTTYDGYTWYIGYLDVGANATLTITARVIAPGNFSNYVEIFGYDNDTNPDNNNATIPNITARPVVDLEIAKEVNVGNVTYVGDTVVFTINVWNHGPCDATNVNVSEVLSPHLRLTDSITWDGYYDVDDGVWYIGTLNSGDWRQLILVAEVVSVGNISNVVSVNSTENDTDNTNNNASVPNITAKPAVDLQIMKDVNVSSRFVEVYDFVEYTITVYNAGPCDATNVMVNETLSPYLKYIRSETKFGNYNVTEGIWHIGDLANGSSANLTIVALVMRNGTVIPNVVVVNSTEKDNNPYDNRDEVDIAALPIVDLRITKEVNVTTDEIGVTDLIKFVVTVYNDGPCDATGLYVIESLSDKLRLISNVTSAGEWDGYTWNIPKLANGTNATLTIIAQVAYEGNISNAVIVFAYQNETNYTNNNASIPNITAISNVDLQITKEANVSGVVVASDLIEFTIKVFNEGPCNATGVYVEEKLSSLLKLISYNATLGDYDGYTWTIGNLSSSSGANLTIVAEVISAGNITNEVIVTSGENDTNKSNNKDNITNITALTLVDLEITKAVNVTTGVVNLHDYIEFTVTVFNHGPSTATNVLVDEALNYHLSLVSYNATVGSYDGYTWIIGTLNRTSGANLTIVAEVISAGNITNVVIVTSSENDTNESNNHANITNITALYGVDLQITKKVNVSGVVLASDLIEFTITVYNDGPCDASGVYVEEKLSSLLKLVSSNATLGSYDGYTWTIGVLNRSSGATLTIVAEVISGGNITNEVIVTSSENDTNKSNNRANITNITALDDVDLEITKVVNVTTGVVSLNDYVEFTVTVYNHGPCDASGVYVEEKLSSLLKLVSSNATLGSYDGYTWTIGDLNRSSGATLTIVAEVISAGNITNEVIVTSTENDTNKSNNHANITNITALDDVDLEITKVVNVTTGVVNLNDYVEFTVTVYNHGHCDAYGVYVGEKLSSLLKLVSYNATLGSYDGFTWTIGTLNRNANATLRIIAKAVAEGNVSNFVTVTCIQNDTNESNNHANITNITVLRMVDLEVNKTVDKHEVRIGDYIEYTIAVHNNGKYGATGVNVTEILSSHVKLISSAPSKGSYDAGNGIWNVGSLANGSTATLKLTVQVLDACTVENFVSVTSNEYDSNLTNNNYTCDNVTVGKLDTPIDLYTYNITYGDDEVLVVTLPSGATGTVNITVGNRAYDNVPINNGKVELPVSDLGGGDYNVTVSYGGDDKYLPNSTAGKFNVAPVTPIITIEVEDIWVWEIEVLNVTVNAPGTVFVTVYGITVEISLDNGVVTTDVLAAGDKLNYKGNATWNIINLPVGRYPAFALYPGNENYTSVNTSDVFYVRDVMPSTVVVTADDIYVSEDAIIKINVGPKGVTGNVIVEVEGKNYTVAIKNGKATLIVPGLNAGEKNVSVWYKGNRYYLPSENETTFNVLKLKPPVDIEAPEITVGEDGVITVKVPSDATGTITIEVEGRNYTAEIKDGKAVFVVSNLTEGIHDIKAYYSGDDKYLPANATGSIKVNPLENETVDHPSNGICLINYPTGNPIFMLLMILILGSGLIRRFKK